MEEETKNKKRFLSNWNLKAVGKKMLIIILGLWIIFSIGYIVRDQWIEFRNLLFLTAYGQGRVDTIRTLMAQAELCQPVVLFEEERRIEVIKVGCPVEQLPQLPAERLPIEQPEQQLPR